ncbi:MAG: hypothetical protein S0880_00290 [Actinomycetota bacterium]|nr:hypothetical protein [Actinomycetota bacterium]
MSEMEERLRRAVDRRRDAYEPSPGLTERIHAESAGAYRRHRQRRRAAAVGASLASVVVAIVLGAAWLGDDGGDTLEVATRPDDVTSTTLSPSTTVPVDDTGRVIPTTTAPPVTSTTMPPTTTAIPTTTVPPAAGPTFVVDGGIVVGWWDGSGWGPYDADTVPPTAGVVLRSATGLPSVTVGSEPTAACQPELGVRWSVDELGDDSGVYVSGDHPIQPRDVVETAAAPAHVGAVRDALAAEGLDAPAAEVEANGLRVLRLDIEGDGVDEVLIEANRVVRDESADDNYSVLVLRRVGADDTAQDLVVRASVGQWFPIPATPDAVPSIVEETEITGVVDGNGDGVFELVTTTDYYEGGLQSLYDLRGAPTLISSARCGA